MLSFFAIARHVHSTQNNNFVKSLHHLNVEGKDEVAFLNADNQRTFLQVDAINCGGQG